MALLDIKVGDLFDSAVKKSESLVKSVKETGDSLAGSAGEMCKNVLDKHKDMGQVSVMRKKIKELEGLIIEKKIEVGDYQYGTYKDYGRIDDEIIEFSCKKIDVISLKIETHEAEIKNVRGLSTNTDLLCAISSGVIACTPEILKFTEEAGVLDKMDASTKEAILKGILEMSKSGEQAK